MKLSIPIAVRLSAVATAISLVCGGAFAQSLPQFTLSPQDVLASGTTFTGDNFIISDYSTVRLTGTTFTDSGFLSVSAIQLGGTTLIPTGLNSTYGLYIAFSGSGTVTAGNPATGNTSGNFTSLDYELRGYNGSATFGFTAGNVPTETASGEIVLATGSLVAGTGTVSTVTDSTPGTAGFVPSAKATLTFVPNFTFPTFYDAPNPFYGTSFASFTNTVSQVQAFDGGFRIFQGGGAFNLATPIPEPETYALMLAGLGVVGFMARRRRS